jgi:mono/diheme cytochrome c family protein
VPASAWTNQRLIARGQQIYRDKCVQCHGDRGDGKGPAAASLSPKPADFTNTEMVSAMAGNYWFWRVSEGGQAEPFRSQGSTMPAWKHDLSVEDRWAVIAYQHTLSGHEGPHVPSEHSALLLHRAQPAARGSGGRPTARNGVPVNGSAGGASDHVHDAAPDGDVPAAHIQKPAETHSH